MQNVTMVTWLLYSISLVYADAYLVTANVYCIAYLCHKPGRSQQPHTVASPTCTMGEKEMM